LTEKVNSIGVFQRTGNGGNQQRKCYW